MTLEIISTPQKCYPVYCGSQSFFFFFENRPRVLSGKQYLCERHPPQHLKEKIAATTSRPLNSFLADRAMLENNPARALWLLM